MKFVGAHVSAAGGVENAPLNAEGIGAKAFALFTKNQKRWEAAPLTKKSIDAFKENLAASGIKPEHVLPHDSYLINLGNPDSEKRKKSLRAFIDEGRRVEQLGLNLLNFHPGSHLGKIPESECLSLIAQNINIAISQTDYVIFVIETTAGQGNNVGYSFNHLADLISKVKDESRIGVCIDTCHIFAAGYDLKTEEDYRKMIDSFGSQIGITFLKGMHLNDAKSSFGSRVDRHDSLGEGNIGLTVFKSIMNDPSLDNLPLILETPDPDRWKDEITLLYSFMNDPAP